MNCVGLFVTQDNENIIASAVGDGSQIVLDCSVLNDGELYLAALEGADKAGNSVLNMFYFEGGKNTILPVDIEIFCENDFMEICPSVDFYSTDTSIDFRLVGNGGNCFVPSDYSSDTDPSDGWSAKKEWLDDLRNDAYIYLYLNRETTNSIPTIHGYFIDDVILFLEYDQLFDSDNMVFQVQSPSKEIKYLYARYPDLGGMYDYILPKVEGNTSRYLMMQAISEEIAMNIVAEFMDR